MERCGLRRAAEHLREGRKINGPILPEDPSLAPARTDGARSKFCLTNF
jgi:hypothetical protein